MALIACGTLGCADGAASEGTLASLRVGVPAPVTQQSSTPLGLQYHRDALTRETLVTPGIDGRPAPRILESWQQSPDGLTWRLKIRPGIRFHDSTPVTAQDLAPSVQRGLMASALGKTIAVTAEGHDVLVVRLRERFAFLPEDLAQVTGLKVVTETDADGKTTRREFGTGPYVVAEESGDRLLLKEFPNHYRGDPGIQQIEVKLFPNQRNAWTALMRDELDVLYEVSRDSLDFVRSESTVTVATFPRPYVYMLAYNSSAPSLKSVKTRQAINHAIDRAALVSGALSSEGEPAAGHIWPRHWAHDNTVQPAAYDPAMARALLDGAGLKLRTLPGQMPARLRLRCLVYAPFRPLALVLQRQLADIDIDLQLEVMELVPLVEKLRKGEFETFLFEMTGARTVMWPYLFWHSSTRFLKHGYSGADDVLDRMRTAASETEMKAATSEFQRRLLDDPPAAFLAWGRVSRAITNRVQLPATEADIYHTIAQWKPAAPRNP